MGHHGNIGGDDCDDRTDLMLMEQRVILEVTTHRNTQDSEVLASTMIGLNQDANVKFLASY